MQGDLSNPIPAGFAIKSSMVPQAGLVSTDLGLAGLADFDTLYQWDVGTQGYVSSTYAFGAWSPAEPTIAVGEAFFLQSSAAHSWDRTFSVND